MKDLKPMRAVKVEDTSKLTYPLLAQPKFDGIRCIIVNRVALSNTLKPIRNQNVQALARELPNGLDGELISGTNFQETTSNIMSGAGNENFTYFVFDLWNSTDRYRSRADTLQTIFVEDIQDPRVIMVQDVSIKNEKRLTDYEEQILSQGHEGIMLRSALSFYKFGRSTLTEQALMKRKPFIDDEAFIIGFEEQKENQNEQTLDGRGYALRSKHSENLVRKDTLGAFIVRNQSFGEFRIGTGLGLTDELRQDIWNNQHRYENQIITYKYQKHGTKDKPRTPIFLRFRHEEDALIEL
jgi:DNA ligase 1